MLEAGASVLLVDNSMSGLSELRTALRDYRLTTARSAREGLSALVASKAAGAAGERKSAPAEDSCSRAAASSSLVSSDPKPDKIMARVTTPTVV